MSNNLGLLMPTTGPIRRVPYAVIDIESKDGETQKGGFTRPFLVGWYCPDTGHYRTKGESCIEAMIAFALTERFDGWCFYAHYGGSFDWLHFLPFIHRMGFHYEIVSVGSSIQLLKVKRSKDCHSKGWTFLDSHKLIPTSLENAAKSFGVTLKKQQDLNLHEDDPSWVGYLEHDCQAAYEIVKRYHELIEIRLNGEVGITAASTAMRTFRRGYQEAPIYRHTDHHDLFRECYYGGRVERFASKVSGIRVYDINSSYPYSMTKEQPVGRAEEWEGYPTSHLRRTKLGFVRAKVIVPDSIHIPVLPYRHGKMVKGVFKADKLLFPTGIFKGSWCWKELAKAEEQGAKVECYDSVWIEKGTPFNRMVAQLYAYRDKTRPDFDQGLAEVAKILLNSLYGKFGMKQDREKLVRFAMTEDDFPPDGARAANPQDPDCDLWYVTEDADADYVCPQIAANVTTESRLLLHNYFEIADSRGILAYGDTDSIQTTADLSDYVGSELGKLKDEGSGEIFLGEYLQPKLYCLSGDRGTEKLTMKGFRPPKQGKRDYYERVKAGEVVTFDVLEKIGRLASRQFASPPRMISLSRSIQSEDGKRVPLTETTSRAIRMREL